MTPPKKPSTPEKIEKKLYTQQELIAQVRNQIEKDKKEKKHSAEECDARLEELRTAIMSEVQENESVRLTSLELQKFVNQENFPPEEVHTFLRARKEITQEAQKGQKGLAAKIKWAGEKALEKVGGPLGEIKEKIKTLTNMSPFERWIISGTLWIGAGLLGVVGSIAAFFGYTKWKEAAEKVKKMKEMIDAVSKDPKAALEKYGAEALEEAKKAEEGTLAGSSEETEKSEEEKDLEWIYGPMIPLREHSETVEKYYDDKKKWLSALYENHKAELIISGTVAAFFGGFDIVDKFIWGIKNTGSFALHILKSGGSFLKWHPILWVSAIAALFSSSKALANIPVPQDPEKCVDFFKNEVLETDRYPEAKKEILDFQEEHGIEIDWNNITVLFNPEKREEIYESALWKLSHITESQFEKIFPEKTKLLKEIDEDGIENFVTTLEDPSIKKHPDTIAEWKKLIEKIKNGEAINESNIDPLLDAASKEGIAITIDDGLVSYMISDGGTQIIRNLCTDPSVSMETRFEAGKKSNIWGLLSPILSEWRYEIGDIGRKLKEVWERPDTEKADVIDGLLKTGSILTIIGKDIVIEGLYERYVIGTYETFAGVFNILRNKDDKWAVHEWLADSADGLVPIVALSYSESALNKILRYRTSEKGIMKGLYRPLLRWISYPIKALSMGWRGLIWSAKNAGELLINRALRGDWKEIFSDPKNKITSHFYEYVERVRSNRLIELLGNDGVRKIVHERRILRDLQHAKALLYKAKMWLLGSHELEAVAKIIEEVEWPGGHISAKDFKKTSKDDIKKNIAIVNDMIEKQKKNINGATIKHALGGISKKWNSLLRGSILWSSWDNLLHWTDDLGRVDALKSAKTKLESDIRAIDDLFEENKKSIDELISKKGSLNPEEYTKELKRLAQEWQKIAQERTRHVKFGKILDIHINPRLSIKGLGRYKKLGILGLWVGALYVMWNSSYKQWEMSPELGKYLDEIDDSTLDKEKDGDKKTEEEGDVERKINATTLKIEFERISGSYAALENIIQDESSDHDKMLWIAIKTHKENISKIKKIVKNTTNKNILLDALNSSKESQIHISPFFSIEMKDGSPHLWYLDEDQFQKYFSQEVESGEFLEGFLGVFGWPTKSENLWYVVADGATYMIPFVGTGRDFYDSYEAFSRWGIGDGFASLAWWLLGAASDALIVTGVGAWFGAAGKAIRGAWAWVKWVKRVRLAKEAFQLARTNFNTLVELAKSGKNLENISQAKKYLVALSKYKGTWYIIAQWGQAAWMANNVPKNTYEKI